MNLTSSEMAHARLAVREAAFTYLNTPNLSMVDFGFPTKGGKLMSDEVAIRFHVHKKLDQPTLQAAVESNQTVHLPRSIGRFQTDIQVGNYHPNWWVWPPPPRLDQRRTRLDPIQGGISVSNEHLRGSGTLGGLVLDRNTGAPLILSNWHVLGGTLFSRPGQRIRQPGTGDGGTANDTVGRLVRDSMHLNIDAAVATLNGERNLINQQLEIGAVTGIGQIGIGDHVIKSGRTTKITTGIVVSVGGIAKIRYPTGDRYIHHVMTIEPENLFSEVSAPGDSGSFWLDQQTNHAVGLHFAGNDFPERGLAIDMGQVLDSLQVDLVVNTPSQRFTPAFHTLNRLS